MTVNFDDPLGTDFSGVTDLDLQLSLVDGRQGLAEAVARRLAMPTGFLFYDSDYGLGITNTIGASLRTYGGLQSAVEAEAMKDERVEEAEATVSYDLASADLEILLVLTDITGETFPLTFKVSEKTAAVIVGEFSQTDGAFN